jgi:hypothetical protein
MGIGALLGLLVAPTLTRMSRPGATMAGVAVLNGLAMLPLAATTGVGVALACCLAIGILWTPYSAVEATALQLLTPARHHGKVWGIQRALVISALPVGAAVGALAWTRSAPLPSSSAPASPASPSPSAPAPSPPSARKSGTRLCLRIADLSASSGNRRDARTAMRHIAAAAPVPYRRLSAFRQLRRCGACPDMRAVG